MGGEDGEGVVVEGERAEEVEEGGDINTRERPSLSELKRE